MKQKLKERLDQLLTEPDISCMDWEIGKTILANWKAGLADQIHSLYKEAGYLSHEEVQSMPNTLSGTLPEITKIQDYVRLDKDQGLPSVKPFK